MKDYGGYKVYKGRDAAKREKTYGPGEYPTGSVPRETGFWANECSNLVKQNHNQMTVCRYKRGRG